MAARQPLSAGPGPTGFLLEHYSWSSTFYTLGPVSLAVIALAARFVPGSKNPVPHPSSRLRAGAGRQRLGHRRVLHPVRVHLPDDPVLPLRPGLQPAHLLPVPMLLDDGYTRVLNATAALGNGSLEIWRGPSPGTPPNSPQQAPVPPAGHRRR
ncbi:MAG: hypothetical protein M3Y33_08970 [Actinomycetota bacterium]|nr:hypothetical protein [Actinomycetota bacterium]